MERLLLLIVVASIFVLSACGVTNNERNQADDDSFIEGEMTDIADLNPNFLNLNEDSGNTNNRAVFQNKIRETAELSDQFKVRSIYMDGEDAVVTVKPVGSYKAADVDQFERMIQKAVPSYHINVRVKGE
jgi:hypothetical protein